VTLSLILFLVHLIPWMMQPNSKTVNDPAKIIFLISGIMTIPYFMAIYTNPPASRVFPEINFVSDFKWLLVYFSGVLTVSLLFILIGIRVGQRIQIPKFLRTNTKNFSMARMRVLAGFLMLVALTLTIMKMSSAGGIINFVASIHLRASLLAGAGHYDIFIIPAANLSIFLLIYSRANDGKPSLLVIVTAITLIVLSLAIFGGRKPPMLLILFSVMAATAYNSALKLTSPKFLLGYIGVVFIFIGLYWVRLHSASNASMNISSELDFHDVLSNVSYLDTYLFILSHFSNNEFWLGESLPEVVLRFIPNYFPTGAPPLDDGVYVRTLFQKMHAEPGMAYDDLYQSSWPPETIGFGYMNFGLAGVALFSFIKGLVTGFVYKVATFRSLEPFSLFIYMYIAINFHFTNLRVFQSLIVIGGVSIFSILLGAAKKESRGSTRSSL